MVSTIAKIKTSLVSFERLDYRKEFINMKS